MPFMELQAQYDMSMDWNGPGGMSFGGVAGLQPAPWDSCGLGDGQAPWNIVRKDLRCPSDPAPANATGGNSSSAWQGYSNYCFSRGDNGRWSEDNNNFRGVFGAAALGDPLGTYKKVSLGNNFSSITDGTSNTIAMSENVVGKNRQNLLLGGIAADTGIETGGSPAGDCMTRIEPITDLLSGNTRG